MTNFLKEDNNMLHADLYGDRAAAFAHYEEVAHDFRDANASQAAMLQQLGKTLQWLGNCCIIWGQALQVTQHAMELEIHLK
jgi:hypothetical protein